MEIKELELEITKIYDAIVDNEPIADRIGSEVHPKYRLSAKNLLRYMVLRTFDLRKIHDSLSDLGLSSLRSSEGYVYTNVSNVLRLIKMLQGKQWIKDHSLEAIGYKRSKKLLRKHANSLFIETEKKHATEIMVTLAKENCDDLEFHRQLVLEGMNIARINLGHDDMETWTKMIQNIRILREEMNIPLKIYMDLSGPKIRTAEIEITDERNHVRNFIRLKEGDHLKLSKEFTKGRPAQYGENQEVIKHAKIGILLPQIIDDVNVGDTVYFDDGMIRAVVINKSWDDVELEITKAYKSKLSTHKGINLPDTHLNLPALTETDIELLPFICEHADLVGYSFVRNADDVRQLYEELKKLNNKEIGVILKVENKEAFENLPLILFEAMKRRNIGVMIARGDLAVEIGFERISEVQNEIMWLCEAAHIPVIWATQVLENLAKSGVATRAEVSDAAISAQAECVMLNKGPHIADAVRTLYAIIEKMGAHTSKKKSTLRPLNVARLALNKLGAEEDLW